MNRRPCPESDAALTYEHLAVADGAAGPIFVGREDLLDIIIGAIRQPDRRGTFLVSGYTTRQVVTPPATAR